MIRGLKIKFDTLEKFTLRLNEIRKHIYKAYNLMRPYETFFLPLPHGFHLINRSYDEIKELPYILCPVYVLPWNCTLLIRAWGKFLREDIIENLRDFLRILYNINSLKKEEDILRNISRLDFELIKTEKPIQYMEYGLFVTRGSYKKHRLPEYIRRSKDCLRASLWSFFLRSAYSLNPIFVSGRSFFGGKLILNLGGLSCLGSDMEKQHKSTRASYEEEKKVQGSDKCWGMSRIWSYYSFIGKVKEIERVKERDDLFRINLGLILIKNDLSSEPIEVEYYMNVRDYVTFKTPEKGQVYNFYAYSYINREYPHVIYKLAFNESDYMSFIRKLLIMTINSSSIDLKKQKILCLLDPNAVCEYLNGISNNLIDHLKNEDEARFRQLLENVEKYIKRKDTVIPPWIENLLLTRVSNIIAYHSMREKRIEATLEDLCTLLDDMLNQELYAYVSSIFDLIKNFPLNFRLEKVVNALDKLKGKMQESLRVRGFMTSNDITYLNLFVDDFIISLMNILLMYGVGLGRSLYVEGIFL